MSPRTEAADVDKAPRPAARPELDDARMGAGSALSAAAAEAEIAAAAAQAHKAVEALADQASQDNTSAGADDAQAASAAAVSGGEADADWEADRSRQIATEHDAALPARGDDAILERLDVGYAGPTQAWGADSG